MKKNYSFYSLLTAIPVALLILMSFSGGQPGNYSGSPGDANQTCTQCHSPGANFGGTPVLTGVPATYAPNQTYNLTLAIQGSSANKFGFNITAENSSNAKTGVFTPGTGSQVRTGNTGLTHTSAGNTSSTWNFTWRSPATNQGNVTFYYATLQANNAGGNSGDQMVAGSTVATLGLNDVAKAQFKMYPTQVQNDVTINLQHANTATMRVYNMTGSLVKEQVIERENLISLSDITTGMYLVSVIADGQTATQRIVKI